MKHKFFKIYLPIITGVALVSTTFSILGALVFARYSRGIKVSDKDLEYIRENNYVYDHVVIFGVDGAGGYFKEMDTPNFDRIFKTGSITYDGLAQYRTESGQNWGSIIHGVRSSVHGIDNSNVGEQKYTSEKYPSFFKAYSKLHPDTYMVSDNDWTAINYGIIEDNIPGMNKIDASSRVTEDTSNLSWLESEKVIDRKVADIAKEEILNNPSILFMHMDCVDAAGHSYGRGKPEYIDAMTYVDKLMGEIYDFSVSQGWENNTLYMCVSDHGHLKDGGHGCNAAPVRHVTLAVNGHKGNIIQGECGYYVTQDAAAIVMYALGEKQPDDWEATVPKNIFKGL